jgi:hypothetical protein
MGNLAWEWSFKLSDGVRELRVDIEDFRGSTAYAKYSKFMIYPEKDIQTWG